jgi:hypothetical protein
MKNKTKNKINKTKKKNGKINKTKYKNKLNKNKTKRGGMAFLYNQIAKTTLKMQLNFSLMINTMSKRSISYEKSLINYSTAFNRYATSIFQTNIKSIEKKKDDDPPISLQDIYNYYYTQIIKKKNKNYDETQKLVILIIFIYKFYSNKLVDKQYYSLWKNKDITDPNDICEYKYFLHEINNLWSNMSRINRMDDYEQIIKVYINPNPSNKEKQEEINNIFNTLIENINDTSTNIDNNLDEIKKYFENKIFNIPNPNCKDIKVNYSYYILVILYYIHYTIYIINTTNKKKGNNKLEELIQVNYEHYINKIENKLKYCAIESSFIKAYELSKGPLSAAMSNVKKTTDSLKSKEGMTDALSKVKRRAEFEVKDAVSKTKSDLSSNAKGMIDSKATGMATPLAIQPPTAGLTSSITNSLLKPK